MTNGFRHKLAITYFEVNNRFGVVIGSQIFNLGKLFFHPALKHVLNEQIVFFTMTVKLCQMRPYETSEHSNIPKFFTRTEYL